MRTLTLLLGILLILAGCTSQPPINPESPATDTPAITPTVPPADLSNAVIAMERTLCFGTCPAYTVTLNGDGSVQWLGERFVEVTGEASGQADPAAVQALVQQFLEAGFMTMQDEYTEQCDANGNCSTVTDLPSTIITLSVEGQEKRVLNYWGGPPILIELAEQVDQVADTAQWIGDGGQ